MVKIALTSMTMAIATADDVTSLLQLSAGVRHSQGQRILAAVAKDGSTICVEAAAGDIAPVAGSFIAKMSQQAVEVTVGSVAAQAGSFCVPKQDVLLMQRTFGLNTARDFEAALGAKTQTTTPTTPTTTTTTIGFENFDFAGNFKKEVMVENCKKFDFEPQKELLQTMDATVAHKHMNGEGADCNENCQRINKERKERQADEMKVCECRSFLESSASKLWNEKLMDIIATKKETTSLAQQPEQIDHQSQVATTMAAACTKASELPVEAFRAYGKVPPLDADELDLWKWSIVAKLLNDPDVAVLYKAANITEGWKHCDQSWVVHGACGEFVEGYCRGHGRACYKAWGTNLKWNKAKMRRTCHSNNEANAENCVKQCKLHLNKPQAMKTTCLARMPVTGDLVQLATNRASERNGQYVLHAGEIAAVVEVDEDGDFKLRNPQGHVSDGFIYRKFYVYTNQAAPIAALAGFKSKTEEGCAQECEDIIEKDHNKLGRMLAGHQKLNNACAEPGAFRDACDCL